MTEHETEIFHRFVLQIAVSSKDKKKRKKKDLQTMKFIHGTIFEAIFLFVIEILILNG